MDEEAGASLSSAEEQEKQERVSRLTPLAKEVVQVLVKTIKATKMYLPNNPVYQKFREELKEKFDAYFKFEDYLSFQVKRFELTFLDQQVYNNPDKEDNIALMFFKDGIREFCFLKDITPEEIEGFIDILKFDVRDRELDDDLVTLMWEKDFRNLTYTATDEATDEEAAEEETLLTFEEEPEAIKQLDELRARALKEAEASPEDIGGGLVQEVTAGDALAVLGVQQEDEDYESRRGTYPATDDLALLIELTDIFYDILVTEKDREHFETVADSLSKALDIFVGRGDLALATILVMKVQELARAPQISDWSKALERIIDKASSEATIKKIGEFIDQGGQGAMEGAGSYLTQLDDRALAPVVSLLETLDNRKARKALCDILVDLCAGNGKPLMPYLVHRFWFVARNVAMVLGKVADPDTVVAFEGALKHEDARVRREALYALASIKGGKAVDLITGSLADPNRQNRVLSGRLLVELAPERAFEALKAVASDKAFGDKEFDEKKEIFELMGRAGGGKAMPFFVEQFRKKGLFNRLKGEDVRAYAAYGLAAVGGEEAYELLRSEIDSKSKALRAACLDGLKRFER